MRIAAFTDAGPKKLPSRLSPRLLKFASIRSFSAPSISPHYLLTYKYPPTILEDRVPHRSGHVSLALSHKADGNLLYAGGLSADTLKSDTNRSVPETGVFLFNDEAKAKEFIENDPYVKEGVVEREGITLKEWACVVTP